MKIKLVTKKRFQINGSGRKPIVLNGNSQPPTAEFRLNASRSSMGAWL